MDKRLEFDAIVAEELKKKSTKQWQTIFEHENIWYAPANEYEQVLQDEQVQYNHAILTMQHPVAGEVKVVGHANRYDGKCAELRRLPPELGQHTEEVLREVGYTGEELAALEKEQIVYANKMGG